MVVRAKTPGQLSLDLNIVPPSLNEIIGNWNSVKGQHYQHLKQASVGQLRRRVRNLRNAEEHEQPLSTRLWNMSKGYSRWNKYELARTVMVMEWEIENYEKTGKVTEG